MVVESVKFIRLIYSRYICYLEDRASTDQEAKYTAYVKLKLKNYDRFLLEKRKSLIDELPRSLRRYQDEFYLSKDFVIESDHYLDDLETATRLFLRYYSDQAL